jgi:HEAT repeat protein
MKKKSCLLFAALLVLVAGASAWVLIPAQPREPAYEGKTVSFWLKHPVKVLESNNNFSWYFPQKMDSNAVPFLVRALETQDGPFSRTYVKLRNKAPDWLRNQLPVPARDLRMGAAIVLYEIGTNAKPAIPALIRRLEADDEDFDVREYSADALSRIGKHDTVLTKVLIEDLKKKDPIACKWLACALNYLGNDDPRVFNTVVESLEAASPRERANGLQAVFETGSNIISNKLMHVLLEFSKSNDSYVRKNSEFVLKYDVYQGEDNAVVK